MRRAILLSGGLDSTALAVWQRPELGITIDYGQLSAAGELRAAAKIADVLGIESHVISVNCRSLGSGDLAGTPASSAAPVSEWWPYRNQLLVTLAAMKALSLGVTELLVGSVETDGAHVDGTADFYHALNHLVAMQEGMLRISAPAITMTTTSLIRTSGAQISLLKWCHSCHVSDFACGRCRGCRKHIGVLKDLGFEDELISVT